MSDGQLPDELSGDWTATEAITWIAFGRADKLATLDAQRSDFRDRWKGRYHLGPIRTLLQSRATSTPCPTDRELFALLNYDVSGDPATPFAPKHGPSIVDAIRQRVSQEQGRLVDYGELVTLLDAEVAELNHRQEAMQSATGRLVAALRADRIKVWALSGAKPQAPPEVVPSNLFRLALTIRRDQLEADDKASMEDWQRARQQPRYWQLRFRAADVRRLWRASTAISQKKRLSPAALREWWRSYLQQHSDPDARPNAAQQLAAAAAYFRAKGYAPPTKRKLLELRADKSITPQEWSEAGRRVKSDQTIGPRNPLRADFD